MGALTVFLEALRNERQAPCVPRRKKDETSFLPAVLEVTETPPSPTARWLTGIIVAIFTTGVVWACVSAVDVVAMAEGRVVLVGRSKVVQPAQTGVIRAIHVRDGQAVKQGEVVVEMDSTSAAAERRRISHDLELAMASAARHRQLSDAGDIAFLPFLTVDGVEPAVLQAQTQLMRSEFAEHQAKLRTLDQERVQRSSERATIIASTARLQETIPLISARSEARADLARTGVGSRLVSLEAKQLLLEAQGDLAVQQRRVSEIDAAIQVLNAQHASLRAEFNRSRLIALAEAEQQIDSLRQDLIKIEQTLRQNTLVAPIDGTVQQLAVHTVSGVVQPSQQLMVIVPNGGQLEVEAYLPNREIGFVQEGQPAFIKLETFNFTRFGTVAGRVCNVSRDSVADEKLGYVYAVRVCLDNNFIDLRGVQYPITAGMGAIIEIKTQSRSIISYLLSPIQGHLNESMRER
jgi:hemolysin D